jgi:60S ribosome subunit biogenesis protein NIP7
MHAADAVGLLRYFFVVPVASLHLIVVKSTKAKKEKKMRPLTDEETLTFFKKLSKYIGKNIQYLLKRPDDEKWCFRLHNDRVYYVSEQMMLLASNFERKKVMSMGTKFGKFTHSGKFHLHVTCMDYVAQFALYKVWLKPSAEMTFLCVVVVVFRFPRGVVVFTAHVLCADVVRRSVCTCRKERSTRTETKQRGK